MFDELRCEYPLPRDGANALVYQTKDLDCQMDSYEIRADGTLWREAYDTRVEENPKAFFGFYLRRENKRWEQVRLTGEVRFYEWVHPDGWLEWSAYFRDGALQQVNCVEDTAELARSADAVDPSATDSGTPTKRA